ncbi:hypothetical protein ACI2K4_14745 [Micromonospora sp. NPDC050397]|uniref:hypothetical protein n=1 Tax=Micromonospora sp. NPDC050397 TaxID=3364279 RepID=UPI00384A6195
MGEEQTQPAETAGGSNTGTLTTTAPDVKGDIGGLPTLAAPPATGGADAKPGSESPEPAEDRDVVEATASAGAEPAEPAPPLAVRETPSSAPLQRRTPKVPQAEVPWSAFGNAKPDAGSPDTASGDTPGSPAATPPRSSDRPWGQPKIGFTIPTQRSGEPNQAPAARASVAVPAVEPPEPATPPQPEPPSPPGPGPAPAPFPPVPAPTPPLPGPMPPAPAPTPPPAPVPTPPRPTPPPPGPGPVPPLPPTPPNPPVPAPVPPFPPPPSTIAAPAPSLFTTPTAAPHRPGSTTPTPSDALATQPIDTSLATNTTQRIDTSLSANITQPISTGPTSEATQPIRLASSGGVATPPDDRGTVYGGPGATAPAEMTVAITTGNPVENTGSLTGHILAQGWADTPTGSAGTGKMIGVLAAGLAVLVAIGLLVVFAAGDTFSSLFGGLLGS